MKTLFLLLVLSRVSAPPAFADITDSGDLIIGGQGILQSSMTVVGDAFSVGGTTLVVTGGKVGIGVSNPTVALEVNGTIKATSLDLSGAAVSETSFAAWVVAVGTGSTGVDAIIMDGYNIDSVDKPDDASYRVNFSTPFATPWYFCACDAWDDGSNHLICIQHPTEAATASAIRFNTRTLSGGVDNAGYIRVGCAGRQ